MSKLTDLFWRLDERIPESIDLPRKIQPQFPERCVVCGGREKFEFTYIPGDPAGSRGVLKWLSGKSGKYRVPAHQRCARKLKRKLLSYNVITLMAAIAVLIGWIALDGLEISMPFELDRTNFIIAVLIVIIPIIFFTFFLNPPAVSFQEYEKSVTFHFKNKKYAKEFASLNKAKESRDDTWEFFSDDARKAFYGEE